MKDYIKLRCENTDFDDDFPDDLIPYISSTLYGKLGNPSRVTITK